MAKQIQATGIELEEYEFLDKNGNHLFTVRFSAADLDIVNRYNAMVDWLDKESSKTDSESKNEVERFFETSEQVKEKIDQLFNAKISKDIFAVMNPFTPLASGMFYVETVMDNIGKLIESELNTRVKKVQSRIDKYTAKYHK